MLRITSRQNPRLQEAARLIASARDRRKAGKCVLEGEHLIAVFVEGHGAPDTLIVSEDAIDRPGVRIIVNQCDERTLIVSTKLLEEFAVLPAGVGIIAVVPTLTPPAATAADFCLLIDDVQDPGNVGSMLRTAAAAGVTQVYLSKHCAFAWAPKVLRAGQGAHFVVDIYEDADLAAFAAAFRASGGEVVAATAVGGTNLYAAALRGRVALAIGNEGAGLSPALLAQSTQRVTIPMPGGMESLNAAAAAAVCVFECVRQRAS